MKIKITNRDLLNLYDAINTLEMLVDKLSIKVYYAHQKTMEHIEKPHETVNKMRFNLLEKYGVKDEKSPIGYKLEKDGRSFEFKSKGDKKKFEDELHPILDEEIEVDIHRISIDEYEGIDLSRQEYPYINFYLKKMVG